MGAEQKVGEEFEQRADTTHKYSPMMVIRHHPRIAIAGLATAVGLGSVGGAKLFHEIHDWYTEAGVRSDQLKDYDELYDEEVGQSRLTRTVRFARRLLEHSRFAGRSFPDIREVIPELYPDTIPIAQATEDELRDLYPFVNSIDVTAQYAFLTSTQNKARDNHERIHIERRQLLYDSGLRVVQPNKDQWEEIGYQVSDAWPFESLRNRRLGIKPGERNFRRAVKYPPGWLALRTNEGAVHGSLSFVLTQSFSDDDIDYESLTFQQLPDVKPDGIKGNTIVLTNLTQSAQSNGYDGIETLMYGVQDFARINGADRVLAPALSPFVRLEQIRDIKEGREMRSYEEIWNERDEKGMPRDRWHRFLSYFGRDLGVNSNFMEFDVSFKDVLGLFYKDNRDVLTGDKIDKNNLIEVLNRDVLFLGSVQVPLINNHNGTWRCQVPAGFIEIYNRASDRGTEMETLYNIVNLT